MIIKLKAMARLRETADRPGQNIQPNQIGLALGDGLSSVLGPLKEIKVRVPGVFTVKVFQGRPGKGMSLTKMLNSLDFTTMKSDATKTFSGTRMEINGNLTYVSYQSPSGIVVVSTNADSIDL